MEMDLQTEKYQTVEEDTQVVEAEPDNNEDSPEEERTYSQAEVEEIIREHLLRFQSLPVQEPQQAELADRELALEKKTYLTQEIHKFATTLPPRRWLSESSSYETFTEISKNLYLFLENEDMDGFIKAVDAIFSLISYAQELSYRDGYKDRADDKSGPHEEIKNFPKEPKKDIITEVFKMGGRI